MKIKIKIFSISTLLIVLTNLNIKAQVYRNAIAAETTIPSINNVVNTGCDVRNTPAGEINSAFVWDGPNASLQIYVENCAGSAINLTAMIALPVGATDPDVTICNNNAAGYQLSYLGVPTIPSLFQNALSVSSKGTNTNITYLYFDGINNRIKYKDVGFQAPNLKMESNESSANISIEPTLILDRCNINLSDGVEHLTLYNIQGAVINTFTYMQTRELESIITKLTPGLYMLNGKFESGVLLSTKFIKQ